MRKLVSVRKVIEVSPIEKADKLELATVDGWRVVVQKNAGLRAGDLVVYCEIDSFLPIHPMFEFLRASSFRSTQHLGEGFRIKTVKLRGALSQGIIFSIADIKEIIGDFDLTPGTDLTEALGVKKYEPFISAKLAGQIRGTFPNFIPKTDQERIQNIAGEVNDMLMAGRLFEMTLKMDGSSITLYHNNGITGVCSRNLELKLDDENNTFVRTAKATGLLDKLAATGNYALQGELVGPGVNGNWDKIPKHEIWFFDIYDIDQQTHVDPLTFKRLSDEWQLHGEHSHVVPVLGVYTEAQHTPVELCDALLQIASDTQSINNSIAEGVVFRAIDGPRYSFKAISNKYLLAE
jgi:RNA ligase (TIGR02306 family)